MNDETKAPNKFSGPLVKELSSRKQEVGKIESAISDPNINIINIQGVAGIGKSALALEILERQRNVYLDKTKTVFINCRENNSLPKILSAMAHQLGIETNDSSLNVLRKHVTSYIRSNPTLLVLDDYEEVSQDDEILSFLGHLPKSTKALVLSRYPVRVSGREVSVRLDSLSENDTLQLLKNYLSTAQIEAIDSSALHAVHSLTGGMPLAIKLVVGLIKDSGSPSEIIERIKNFKVPADQSVKQILQKINDGLPPRQRKLLGALSLFVQPAEGKALLSVTQMKDWRRVAESLVRKSIIERAGDRFVIHPLVRAYYLTDEANSSEQAAMLERMVAYMLSVAQLYEYNYERVDQDWLNIQHAIETAYSKKLYDQFIKLLIAIQRFVNARGHHELYEVWISRGVKIAEKLNNLRLKGNFFFTLGRRHREEGKFNEALNALRKSLQFSIEAKNQSQRAKILKELGHVYESIGDRTQAKQLFIEALSEPNNVNIVEEINVLLSLSSLSRAEANYDEALEYASKALTFSRRLKLAVFEAYSLLALGDVYGDVGNINECKKLLDQALSIWRKIGDRSWEAITLRYLAHYARVQGQFKEAEAFVDKEVRIYREIGDQKSEGFALQFLGLIYIDQHKYDEAKVLLNQALNVSRELNDTKTEALILYRLGVIAESIDQHSSADEYLKQSLFLSQNFGFRKTELYALLGLGNVALSEGRTKEAEGYFEQALKLSQTTGDANQQGNLWLKLGSIYYDQVEADEHNVDKSINAYLQALNCLDPETEPADFSSVSKTLGDIYRDIPRGDKLQNIEKAINYYHTALKYISKEDFPYLWGQIHFGLGIALVKNISGDYRDDTHKAIDSLKEALTVFSPNENSADWGNTLSALIGLYSALGQWSEAKELTRELIEHVRRNITKGTAAKDFLPWYELLSDIAEKHQDYEFATQLLAELSYLFELQNIELPESVQVKLLSLKNLIGDDRFILISAENRGLISPVLAQTIKEARQFMGDELYAEAVSKLSDALEIINDTDSLPDIDRKRATVLFLKGYSLRKQGNWTESLRDQEIAFKLFEKIRDYVGAARSLLEIGYLYELMNNYEDSRIHYMDAYRLSNKAGNKAGMALASESLGRLEYRVRLLPQAIENLTEAQRIYRALGERAKAAAIETDLESAQSFLSTLLAKQGEGD